MEDENGFFLTPEYLDIQRQLQANRAAMQAATQEFRSLSDPLIQQSNLFSSPEGIAQLRQQLAPQAQNQLATLLNSNPAYQSIVRTAAGYESGANLLQSAKQRAIETGQVQSVQFAEPDGVTRWNLRIEPPGKSFSYDERRALQNQGISPVDVNWVDEYSRGLQQTAQSQKDYATFAGLTDLASGPLANLGFGVNKPRIDPNTPYQQQAQTLQNWALQAINEDLAQRQARERVEAAQSSIRQLEQRFNPIIEGFDQPYNEIASQIAPLGLAYQAAQNARQLGRDPTQEVQKFLTEQAQSQAQTQATNTALDQQRQEAIANMLQTGVIPANTQLTAPQVTAPQVAAPTVPQYSFLSAQPAPVQTATQPAQTPAVQAPLAAQPTTTAPVAQPVTQPTAQAPVAAQAQPSFLGGIPVGTGTQVPTTTGIPMATTPSLNPATLPELRSAGGGGTSAIDPTLRPYLELGLRAAEQQFLQNVPQFFPGQTYVSPSQQTLDALTAQEQIARQAPATLQAAQESYMRGLGGLGATASGAFLSGNPFQQQMIQAATRPIMQQFEEQTLPGIASGFSQAGRYGSGAMERILGRATESTARAIGDVSTNIAFQDYGAERGRQQQAILGQITAAGQAPQIYGQQFLPSQQLAQIGAAREAIAGLPLQEQMARFQFAQQAPRESLSAFLSSVYGTPMASSQYAPTPQAQTNRAGNVFGGLATGAGIGSMLGGTTGAGYGAALGALGGLLL